MTQNIGDKNRKSGTEFTAYRLCGMSDHPVKIDDIFKDLENTGKKSGDVSVSDIMEALHTRSYGPFLMIPALIVITPIGAIPTVPTIMAAIIILIAAQMVWGRKNFWLPAIIKRQSVPHEKLMESVEKMRPFGKVMDKMFRGRLPALTKPPFTRIAAALCILFALSVPPLELLPFAAAGPMAAIALIGLALLVKDGYVMIAAFVVAAGAAALGLHLI